MGRDKHEKRRRNRLPPFVPLLIATLDTPAWLELSHGAKALYIALRRRYFPNNPNNGRIFLSQRMAVKEIGSHHNQIARWFRELQHYGFIVMTAPGYLGVEGKGQSPRWRLTELDYMKEPPTRDFTRWDGTPFVDKKISRAGKQARGVQELTHASPQKGGPQDVESVPGSHHKRNARYSEGKHAQNYVTTRIGVDAASNTHATAHDPEAEMP